jgi:hypothetical protein
MMISALVDSKLKERESPLLVLVHGLGRTIRSMRLLEREGRRRGYQVINWGYPSRRRTIQGHATALAAELSARLREHPGRVDFATHSLGGLIVREYLRAARPPNCGRVVMLAPPNRGTEVVDVLGRLWLYRLFTGAPGKELGTRRSGAEDSWPAPGVQLGIIAGSGGFNPLFARWLPSPHDGTVPVSRTVLEGMSDFIVLRCGHTFMPSNGSVREQVFEFLLNGKFSTDGTARTPSNQGEDSHG